MDIPLRAELDHSKRTSVGTSPTPVAQFLKDDHCIGRPVSHQCIHWAGIQAPGIFTLVAYLRNKEAALLKSYDP
jgi:hypothetical protein